MSAPTLDRTPTTSYSTPTLAAFVVGSMIGAGVFSLPSSFAGETGVAGALIAWAIAGTGMFALALVFQRLASARPDLDAGVYSYAKTGFGHYVGFLSAFGYWASACAGNVFYWVFIMSTLGAVFPGLGAGDTVPAVLASSVGLWLFYLLVRRGVRQAAALNRIVSIAKALPILVFIVLALTVFDPAVFAQNWTGGTDAAPLFDQVRATMLVTVFVFIGVEGASVNSRHAKRRRDVGRATVFGFVSVLAVFASVTIVSYGILPRAEIADLRQPSMGGILEAVVGPWGAVFIGVALIVSVLGAYLAWTLMAAEVLMVTARDGDLPRILARTNRHDTPVGALTLSTIVVQIMLVVVLFSQDAFDVALDLTSSLALIPYFLTAAFALKVALMPAERRRVSDIVLGLVATAYTAFMLYAGGTDYLLISLAIIVPGTILFALGRRERGERVFRPVELIVFLVLLVGAIAAVVMLATGAIAL